MEKTTDPKNLFDSIQKESKNLSPKISVTTKCDEKQIALLEAIEVLYGCTKADSIRICIDEVWKLRGEDIIRKAEFITSSKI